MSTVPITQIIFDTPIKHHQISAFRGCLAKAVGYEHVLFHNHLDGRVDQFRYRYPLIQYKRIYGKAAVVFVKEGTEEAEKLLKRETLKLTLHGKKYRMNIEKAHFYKYTPKILKQRRGYQLRKWLALNGKNYEQFLLIEGEEKRVAFLNKILIANILAFCRSIEWYLEVELKVNITEVISMKQQQYKRVPLTVFDVRFITNISLPNYIGLGKGVSRGHGVLFRDKVKK